MIDDIQRFITRWQASGAAERANYQLFLSELCDVLDAPRPDRTTLDEIGNTCVFDKSVPLLHGATGRIDMHRRGCFVPEAKQGSDQHARCQLFRKVGISRPLSVEGEAQVRGRKKNVGPRGAAAWDTAMEKARPTKKDTAEQVGHKKDSAATIELRWLHVEMDRRGARCVRVE